MSTEITCPKCKKFDGCNTAIAYPVRKCRDFEPKERIKIKDNSDLIYAFAMADGYDFSKFEVDEIEDRAGKIVSIINDLVKEKNPSELTIGSFANIGMLVRGLKFNRSLKGDPMFVELCTCGRDLHAGETTIQIDTGERSTRDPDGFNPL